MLMRRRTVGSGTDRRNRRLGSGMGKNLDPAQDRRKTSPQKITLVSLCSETL